MWRLRNQPPRGAREHQALAQARRARRAVLRRLARGAADLQALQAADARVAAEVIESRRSRAQARVEFAVQRSHFPRVTKRLAEDRPELAAAIRQLASQHRMARKRALYRRHDREHQQRLGERREQLLREAWAVATACCNDHSRTA
jgi:hypothetical protein